MAQHPHERDHIDVERRPDPPEHLRPAGHGFEMHAEVTPTPHHTVSVAMYWKVFGWLMVLLVLTLVAAMFDLGWVNVPIALTIAGVKMFIVVLYFMHLKYSSFLIRGVAVAGFIWLAILFVFTLSDYLARDWVSTRVDPIRQGQPPQFSPLPDR
jgi:cytochrome c oxidase subunit IV